jgi:hypothetical protein
VSPNFAGLQTPDEGAQWLALAARERKRAE